VLAAARAAFLPEVERRALVQSLEKELSEIMKTLYGADIPSASHS